MALSAAAASIIAAGIGAAGGIGTNFIQGAKNKKLAKYQYELNMEAWQKQNAYNSPIAQRKRLEDAGLNPALMYGGGQTSTGNANSIPQYQEANVDIASNMLNMMQMAQMHANIRKTEAEAKNVEKQNEWYDVTQQAIVDNYLQDVEVKKSTVKNNLKSIEEKEVNIQRAKKETEKINEEIQYIIANTSNTKQLERLNVAKEGLVIADTILTNYSSTGKNLENKKLTVDVWFKEWEKKFTETLGFKPDGSLQNMIVQLLGNAVMGNSDVGDKFLDVIDKFKEKWENRNKTRTATQDGKMKDSWDNWKRYKQDKYSSGGYMFPLD